MWGIEINELTWTQLFFETRVCVVPKPIDDTIQVHGVPAAVRLSASLPAKNSMVHAITHALDVGGHSLRVREIEFCLMSDEAIRAQSAVTVDNVIMYTRGLPSSGGVNDLRMGTTDHKTRCCTCGNTVYDCPGHPGHIELPLPVYHGMYLDVILKTLRTLCFWCARPKKLAVVEAEFVVDSFPVHYGDCRFCRTCEHCGGPQPHYTRSGCNISIDWNGAALENLTENELALVSRPFNPYVACTIFRACTDEDWKSLGYSRGRPENMTPWTVVVPPPVIRPAIVNDAKCRGQDDLTHILQSINKKACGLRGLIGTADVESISRMIGHVGCTGVEDSLDDEEQFVNSDDENSDEDRVVNESGDNEETSEDTTPEEEETPRETITPVNREQRTELEEAWERMQIDVAALCNNTSRSRGQALQRSGAPTRTMKHRLCGKHGRLRENMMGKRTNQSARSVISPDPTLDIEEIGIPERLAKILTIPEHVNEGNLHELTARVRRGPGRLDGAATIITFDGRVIDLDVCPEERRMNIRLRPAAMGRKGDVVERFLTDGDGDPDKADVVIFNRQPSLHKFSMMGHRVRILPGDTLRMNELAARPYNADFDGDEMNIHVPQSIAARIEVQELMMVSQLIMSPQGNRPVIGLVQDSLLGAYLLSAPDCTLTWDAAADILTHVRFPTMYSLPPRTSSRVTGRQLVSTLLPRITLRLSRKSKGEDDFVIQDGCFISGRLDKRAIGTGAGGIVQVICQDYGSKRAARFLSDMQSVVMRFLARRGFSMGIKDCILPPDRMEVVKASVNHSISAAQRILDDRDAYSGLGMTDEAEAAVTRVASAAISTVGAAVVGQMEPDNSLLTMITAGSKGNPVNYVQIIGCVGQNLVEGQRIGTSRERTLPSFVRNNYNLDAHGFVSNSYVDGLTPNELFFHAMGGREGLVDTAVKTAVTGYLQRRTVKGLEEKAIGTVPASRTTAWRPVLSAKRSVIQLRYGGDGCDGSRLERVTLPLLADGDGALRSWVRGNEVEFHELASVRDRLCSGRESLLGVDLHPHAYLPVSVARLVESITGGEQFESVKQGTSPADFVNALCVSVTMLMGKGAALPLIYTIRYWLCSAWINERALSVSAVAWVCNKIRIQVAHALVAPGEMVGIVTAQMIGEPLTQLTLNTFHLAGVGNQTQGIARVKELIDVTKKPKTPSVILPLIHCLRPAPIAERFARALPCVTLDDIKESVHYVQINDAPPTSAMPMTMAIEIELAARDATVDIGSLWMAEIRIHREKAKKYNMTSCDVARVLRQRSAQRDGVPQLFVSFGMGYVCVATAGSGLTREQRSRLIERVTKKLCLETALGGVGDISHATVHNIAGSESGGAYANATVIRAAGGSLQDCFGIDGVEWDRTYSDNICDVLVTLGIEAARTVLLRELTKTICCDGTYIDSRHLTMLVDSMCARGYLMPMSRHGINRGARDETMKKCSYEETMEVLATAALCGHTDNMDGVTPSVAFGQYCRSMGTAATSVWYDSRQIWSCDSKPLHTRDDNTRHLAVSVVHRTGIKAVYRTKQKTPQRTQCEDTGPSRHADARDTQVHRPVPLESFQSAGGDNDEAYIPPSPRTLLFSAAD